MLDSDSNPLSPSSLIPERAACAWPLPDRPEGWAWGAARVAVTVEPGGIAPRHRGRQLARCLGFAPATATLIVSAVAELAWNMMSYAGGGQRTLAPVERSCRLGLPGVRRILDKCESASGPTGTTVGEVKWL